jgi:anti-sigma factor RsiW
MPDNKAAQFDDELLSAYLDDELAPEERARVEQRLASDPGAKQLLEELRAVSQAVKAVPSATVGTDLRESVLRRAERTMLLPGERASARGLNEMVRKLPFGRSKRAWFWAGAALAAGLMLMFFEREPERNEGLPGAVALRDRSARLETLSAAKPAAQEELGERVAAETAAPASAPLAAASADRADHGSGGVGGAVAAGAGRAAEARDSDDLLVVRVTVKPEALRNRAIDAVLARNQIEVEQPIAQADNRSRTKNIPAEPQDVDVLLLAAEPAQVMSTLADLGADHANFLGIEVDDERAGRQWGQSAERWNYDFQQYDRGVAPDRQKVEVALNRNYVIETKQGRFEIERNVGREMGLQQQLARDDLSTESEDARARRIEPPSSEQEVTADRYLAEGQVARSSGSSSASPPAPPIAAPAESALSDSVGGAKLGFARRASQKLAAKANLLEVLFVLTAGDEPASARPTAAMPSTAPPAEEGLKNGE